MSPLYLKLLHIDSCLGIQMCQLRIDTKYKIYISNLVKNKKFMALLDYDGDKTVMFFDKDIILSKTSLYIEYSDRFHYMFIQHQ